jgi:hypothetical protein
MYKIERVPSKHRVEMFLDNYEGHDQQRFLREVQQTAISVRNTDGSFDVLADFTESIVMPQEISQESADLAAWLVTNGMRRSANIIRNATQRMQIKRVTAHDERFGYFENRAEAETWLSE